MSEKRFKVNYEKFTSKDIIPKGIMDNKKNKHMCRIEEVCSLLNEQQELIEELHISDHMGWGRAEKFEKELKQKKIYIKRLEYKVQKFKEENEQLKNRLNEEYIKECSI